MLRQSVDKQQTVAERAYRKPVLTKGPVLASVTAQNVSAPPPK
jgi:hypothetical protein